MIIKHSLIYSFFTILILFVIGYKVSAHQTENHKSKHNILILHSYHLGFKWTDNVHEGLMGVFKNDPQFQQFEIYTEFLDSKRIWLNTSQNQFINHLAQKYSNIQFDAVITSDDNAFEFATKMQDTLFNHAPLVFCGVNHYNDIKRTIHNSNYTGVVEGFNLPGTIGAALNLLPNTNKILIINDTTLTGKANRAIFEHIKDQLPQHITYEFCSQFDMDSVKDELSKYDDQTTILLLSYNTDKKGQYYNYEESGKLICEATSLPVIVVWDFYLETGVLGGLVVSGKNQGNTAAELTLQIIAGTSADSIPVVTQSPNQYMFDYKELINNNIDMDLLPKQSIILNKPVNIFYKYLIEIIGVFTLMTIMGLSIIVLFIMHRRKAIIEQNLLKSRNKFSTILETAIEGFIEFDNQGFTLNVNREMCQILEVKRDSIIGEHVTYLARFSSQPEVIMSVFRECNIGNSVSIEQQILTPTQQIKHVILNAIPLFDSNNKVIGGFATIIDITEIKGKETELVIAKNKAEQSDRLKTAFLANMSHEIRTPMNAILGFSSLIKENDLEKEQRDGYISLILSSSNHLMNLLSDILDLSKIDSGQIDLKVQPINLNVFLDEIEKNYNGTLEQPINKNVAINFKPNKYDVILQSDIYRIRQVLLSLINNSMKFTHEGFVEFGYEVINDTVRFYVTDTGIGIDDAIKESIFERFQKLESSDTHVYRGTGLGLSLSKSLVELLGGKIWHEPNFPKGTKFVFTVSGKIEILPRTK